MLKAIVREYEDDPGRWRLVFETGESIDGFDIAEWAGFIGKGHAEDNRYLYHGTSPKKTFPKVSNVSLMDIPVFIAEMKAREWVTQYQSEEGYHTVIEPTPKGIDEGRRLLRPRYIKMWDFMKGDVRTVIVAGITAVVVAVVTALVMRALGGT
jgi:hypothetical protein